MNILTIMGSPRRRGNTATRYCWLLKSSPAHSTPSNGWDVVRQEIRGCLGCDACQKDADHPGCVQKDDLNGLLQKIIAADLVVYASPVYVWDFPAQMKAVLDRHYCLVKWMSQAEKSLIENKKTMLLTTCGGDAEDNSDIIRQVFEREMKYLHCQIAGEFVVPNCTSPSEMAMVFDGIATRMVETVSHLA